MCYCLSPKFKFTLSFSAIFPLPILWGAYTGEPVARPVRVNSCVWEHQRRTPSDAALVNSQSSHNSAVSTFLSASEGPR